MRTEPLITIIMPVYNAVAYVNEAVQSCIAQSWSNWELIIINDGSTDGTKSLLEKLDDSRIHVIHQSNRGVSSARNVGLELKKGEYITFLDADDVLPSKGLEARGLFLQENPEVDVVDGIISVRDASMHDEQRCYRPYYTGKLLPRLLKLDDRTFFGPSYMLRSSRLGGIRFADGMSHAEDLRFYIEIADRCDVEYAYVNEIVYLYRKSDSSAMANFEGLEEGYLTLLESVKGIQGASLFDKLYMKLKVATILFLCWRSRGEYAKAIKATAKCVF